MKIDDPNEIDQDTQESLNEEDEFTGKTRWFEFTEKISTYPCNSLVFIRASPTFFEYFLTVVFTC